MLHLKLRCTQIFVKLLMPIARPRLLLVEVVLLPELVGALPHLDTELLLALSVEVLRAFERSSLERIHARCLDVLAHL